MLPSQPSLNNLIDCLKVNYRLDVKSIIPLSGGADINASLYKAQTPDHSYFLKLKKGDEKAFSFALMDLLRESGIQEIIPPLKTIDGSSFLQIEDFNLVIFPFIEGVNGFSQKLTGKQWTSFGKALRRVHDFDVPPSLIRGIRKETYSSKWRQLVRLFYSAPRKESPEKDHLALKFLSIMNRNRAVIEDLIDRASELSTKVKKIPSKSVLCHSDIHGGNILIKNSEVLYLVDWDDPIMAPKERDLMFIGGGVGNIWNDPQEEASFYKGYGKTEIDNSLLAYYRHERIVQDVAEFTEILLDSRHKDRVEMLDHFISMFNPNGVVEIALKAPIN